LVYDVVAATRTVYIVPDAEALKIIFGDIFEWAEAVSFAAAYSDGVNSDYRLPTRDEAVKILGNSLLISQLELPMESWIRYWTIEEISEEEAYYIDQSGYLFVAFKTYECYALPVRSEVVPET
jgi:hypothetical protein